jgi:Domain of unknown function (DUF4124)
MKPIVATLVVGTALAFSAFGADIYVWTDENGKTHLADSVPPKYKASAQRIDSRQFELTPEQRREADARLELARKALAASSPPTRPAQAPAAARPAPLAATASTESNDCEALQREYNQSLECFAPFVNANGTLKPEAFMSCKSVVNPTQKCGSAKAY